MPLFLTQALAAFNDNFLKNFLVFFILATAGHEAGAAYVTAAGAVFMLPFGLLSGLGGELADKFDKASVARKLKFLEIGAAGLAAAGFWFHSLPTMMAALFMFGVGSALFGPLKYGILPDHLPAEKLPRANAWIEAATFVSILAGTVTAGLTYKIAQVDALPFSLVVVAVAVGSYSVSRMIPSTGAADPTLRIDANVVRSTARYIREIASNHKLLRASLMASFFWFAGAVILSLLPPAIQSIGGDEAAVTVYLSIFAVSIGFGSAASAWLSGGRIVLLPAVFATAMVGIFALDFASSVAAGAESLPYAGIADFLSSPVALRVALDVSMMAFFGAFVAVPTFAAIQTWASKERRARIVAANNILNAIFMVVGAGLIGILQAAGASIPQAFIVLGAACIGASVAMFVFLPTKPLKDFLFVAFRLMYRIEVKGTDNLAAAGGNPVIALTHVSFLDAALAMAVTDLEPVFAINADIAKKWWVRPFLRVVNALPLDPTKPMATRSLIRVVESGRPVAIFPEGRITVTGTLMKVYDGAAMVADKTGVPLVPVRIEGLERTHFSRLGKDQVAKRYFPKVKVTILPPEPLSVDATLKGRRRRKEAGDALYKVMSDLVYQTARKQGTILQEVITAAETYGYGRVILQDPVSGSMTYGRLLTTVRLLASKIVSLCKDDRTVGIMLPNSVGTAALVLGVMSAGKSASMVNFTAGSPGVAAACRASKTRVVITSKAFVEKAKLDTLVSDLADVVEIVYAEDIRASVTLVQKLVALFGRGRPLVASSAEEMAVVLYTSGSEGNPKGVALSHANILANATQASARVDFSPKDKVFNVLPVFHAFGLTGGLILPLVSGVGVYLYPSPLHYRIVPELIYSSNATIIFGTDTFLNGYAKTANPYDMRSIRYVFAGAEKVYEQTRQTYMSKFGVRILEGYGVTEAAPIVCINTPMFNKAGSVGKILPGIEYRLEAFDGVEGGGRLSIRGPNVMMGYMTENSPGVLQPPQEGWHDTGDVVTVDVEGYVTIVDRAGRFANIAGEKVSLGGVQTLVNTIWPGVMSVAVNLPCTKKGERIVVLTEKSDASLKDVKDAAKAMGLPELVVPSSVVIGKVPILGTGKVDFQRSKKAAAA